MKFLFSIAALMAVSNCYALEYGPAAPPKAQSFFVKPGFKDGKIQSVSLGVSLDGRDSNALLVTNLDSYKVFNKTVETVATVSTDRYGNKAAVGAGVLVPLGEHFGVSFKAGAYFEGPDLADKGRVSNRFVPAVTARIDLNKTLSVFGVRL
jgi:hypothetical protein